MESELSPIEPVGHFSPTPARTGEPTAAQQRPPAAPERAHVPQRTGNVEGSSSWAGSGKVSPAYAHYLVDPVTHMVRVQIRDAVTNEVIKEIPAEEVARAAEAVRAYITALQARRSQTGSGS